MRRFLLDEAKEDIHTTHGLGNASAHRVALPSAAAAACAEEVIVLDLEKGDSEKNDSCVHSVSVETVPELVSKDRSVNDAGIFRQDASKKAASEPTSLNASVGGVVGTDKITHKQTPADASGSAPDPSVSQPRSPEEREKQDAHASEKNKNSSSYAARLSALHSPLSLQGQVKDQNPPLVGLQAAPVNPGSHHDADTTRWAMISAPTRATSNGNRVVPAQEKLAADLAVHRAHDSVGGWKRIMPDCRGGFAASKPEPRLQATVLSVVPSSSISVGAKIPRELLTKAPGDLQAVPKRVRERSSEIFGDNIRCSKTPSWNRATVSTDPQAWQGSKDGFSINPHTREVDILQSKWVVGQLLPASQLRSRLARLQGPRPHANALPRRIFIGTIDLWRPYCSHMSAQSMNHPLGWSDKDVVSFCRPKDVEVPGMKDSHVRVLAREMGLDFGNYRLFRIFWHEYLLERGINCEIPQWLLNKSSYAWDDKTDMSVAVLDGLVTSIDRKDLEVRWELHHIDSDNKRKAFAHTHDVMENWDSATLGRVFKDQLDWLNKRHEAIQSLPKFDTSNCCLLRASIYVTPNALGSNMVTSAKACADSSHYFYMKPLDRASSLAECSGTPDKGPHPWSDVEMRVRHGNAGIIAVFAALKSIRDTRLQGGQSMPPCAEESRQRQKSPNVTSPFQSLCRTYRDGLDKSIRNDANELVNHLKDLSVERGMDSENKTSVDAILSSKSFIVSDGYSRAARQPGGIGLPLRLYQRESLAWMIDQERRKSISEPFWTKIYGKTVTGDSTDLYYSPLTGSLARYPPPPVVGGVLAEEMGLGKTLIMISLIISTLDDARRQWRLRASSNFGNLRPSSGTLIVCPVSLLKQWEQELKTRVSMPLKILLWYGQSRPQSVDVITSFDVVLTTYGILSQSREYYVALTKINWHRLVIDESTYLRGGANTCSAVLSEELVSLRRWAVSGTPFGNNFRNFLGTMRFLGVVPFSSSKHFEELARVATESADNLTQVEDFHLIPQLSYVLKNLMIRHLKDQDFRGQTLVELPPATGRYVGVQLSSEERALYDAMESEAKTKAARYLRSEKSTGSNIIALRAMMIPLRVMADGVQPEKKSPASSGPRKKEENVPFALSKVKVEKKPFAALDSSKIRQLVKDVQAYRAADPNSKFVVFTEFRNVKDKIQTTLKNHGLEVLTLEGNMSAGRRGKMIRMFAEDADAAVLVLSMRLGACGLTLTMANVVVLFEAGLDMAIELQAVNRIHRIGQTRQVETLTYVAEGTIDERMTDVRKRRGQPRVVGESIQPGQKEDLSTAEVYKNIFEYSRP